MTREVECALRRLAVEDRKKIILKNEKEKQWKQEGCWILLERHR